MRPISPIKKDPEESFLTGNLQAFFDSLDSFREPVLSQMLRCVFGVQVASVTLQAADTRFNIAQTLFDFPHVFTNTGNVCADCSQGLNDDVFDVFHEPKFTPSS